MASPKRFFVGGNFKAAGNTATVAKMVATLNSLGNLPSNTEVVIAPSALHIGGVKAALREDIGLAVQDVHTARGFGAYTGAHTADLVADAGLKWTLVGHSERRVVFGETDAATAAKTAAALDAGLSVLFCIGESLAEREAGATMAVCQRQLSVLTASGGAPIPAAAWSRVVVAYEPVWAIGTGKVATPAQAQEVHASLRAWLAVEVGAEVAAALRIVYGGSVNVRAGLAVSRVRPLPPTPPNPPTPTPRAPTRWCSARSSTWTGSWWAAPRSSQSLWRSSRRSSTRKKRRRS